MKNARKFLLISTLAIVFLFYRVDSVVAIANEQLDTSDVNSESTVESETEQKTEPDNEPDTEPVPDFVSTGSDLIEWLEAHKNTGGSVMLTDNIVLDGYHCYCPDGMNRPDVFVDTDKYTITVTGEIELMSDDHLTFSGQPDGKSVFYVAPKGALSLMGVAVERGQCALWQEEGAGLVLEDCHISGSIHYADTPFVIKQNPVYIVVEKEQTVTDVLPTEISCTVNRQGDISGHERVPLSWNLEGSEKQQADRLRFQLQGSFLQAASAEPALCTVVYNDYPLTFLEVTAADDGTRYTFRGGYTKPEEALPITVISEYSFDGENWSVYEENNVSDINAGFYIAFQSEERGRTAYPNIYIRLQWNDNGTEYFSNVLCYEAANLDHVEDIGGNRGGGTSIINLPENPEVTRSEQEPTGRSDSDTDEPDASSDTDQAESGDSNNGSDVASDEQSLNTEAPNVNAGQSQNAESLNSNADSLQYPEAKAANTDRSSHSETKTDTDVRDADATENNENLDSSDSDISQKEEAVAAISVKNVDGNDLPQIKEQVLRSDIRESNAMIIATGFVLLSVLAGIMGFTIHSRSGTNR